MLININLTPSKYAFLINARNNPGASGAELARIISVIPQSISVLGKKLSAECLVIKRNHERFDAIVQYWLSPEGLKKLESADAIIAQYEQDIMKLVTITDIKTTQETLETIQNNFKVNH